MIVLFTVLRLLAILIVSHDMSGLLKTWKSKCWFIAGSLLLSLFVVGITGSLLALLFCYLFLNKISSSEKNSFLFTFLPWVFVEVTSKLLQLYFFPWIFQINYLQVKDTPVLILCLISWFTQFFIWLSKCSLLTLVLSMLWEITILTKLDNAYWLGWLWLYSSKLSSCLAISSVNWSFTLFLE